ncbi:uncharacterized protein LOC144714905 [Wolffia australiana]
MESEGRRRSLAMEDDGPASSAASFASCSSVASSSGLSYIEHRVSKLDTLAGVAIKYGVEVADIKKMNGLVTDIQMFALRSLQIPLPGRHPPSSSVSNGSSLHGDYTTPEKQQAKDPLTTRPPRRHTSAAMKTLQGYYGLAPPRCAPHSAPPRGHRKSMSLVNAPPPELLLKEDHGGVALTARASASKGLAQRQKAANCRPETAVKKSSSASDLQETRSEGRARASWKNKAALD